MSIIFDHSNCFNISLPDFAVIVYIIGMISLLRMKNPVPIATDIPAATIPEVGTSGDALVVNAQSPSNFHVQLIQSQYQLHRSVALTIILFVCYE